MIPLARIKHGDNCASHGGASCDCDRVEIFRDQVSAYPVALQRGDVLVLETPRRMSHDAVERLRHVATEAVEKFVGYRVPMLVVEEGKLRVMRPERDGAGVAGDGDALSSFDREHFA